MNILLTCVGRRNYLVEYFRDAVGPDGSVICVNSDPMTSGMLVADKSYQVPKVDSPDYIDVLLKICIETKVKLVVSLFDIDLPFLSMARDRFLESGIHIVVSDPWVIDMANDKWKTALHLQKSGLPVPKSFVSLSRARRLLDKKALDFPLVIKPRWGMGSIAIFKADNIEELLFFHKYVKKQINDSYLKVLSEEGLEEAVLIQEYIPGVEYGVDVLNDMSGRHVATVIKRKIAMRSGETDIAEIVENKEIYLLSLKLSKLLVHRGNIDVDIIDAHQDGFKVLEINARFGGGYPFSHMAGARFTNALVDMVCGVSPRAGHAVPGVIGLKGIKPLNYYHP